MKRINPALTGALAAAMVFLPVLLHAADWIRDDYTETNRHSVHSQGWLTYGAHTNTFNLRKFYLRYNFQLSGVQFFATVSGYKDTHNPPLDYPYVLPNVQMYDYGAAFRFFDLLDLSLRGAAVYSIDTETYLLVPHYSSTNDPAEFDSPPQYMEEFVNAAGLRIGLSRGRFAFGYSQGDYRHLIPMGAVARYDDGRFGVRVLAQLYNYDPLVYDIANYRLRLQTTATAHETFGDWTVKGLAEFYLVEDSRWDFRFEEAVVYDPWDVTFAMRQIAWNDLPALFEFSLSKRVGGLVSLGAFAGTDGRIYIGTSVDF